MSSFWPKLLGAVLVVLVLLASGGFWWLNCGPGHDHHIPAVTSGKMVRDLGMALQTYFYDTQQRPPADNRSIARLLGPTGENYITFKEKDIDSTGQILDGWGQPIHFAYQDTTERRMLIYSSGRNGNILRSSTCRP